VVAAVAGSLGRTDDGLRAVAAFLRTLPPDVARLVAQPIADVIGARASDGVLTLGIVVTLWTVTGFMETIRQIIRRAYHVEGATPQWRDRIGSLALVFAAVLIMLAALAAQVVLTGAETFVDQLMPFADGLAGAIGIGRVAPALAVFIGVWLTFLALTPRRYRMMGAPIWPGALVTTLVWIGTTRVLPLAIGVFGGYSLTYGSLAGVIVALLFFYIIGLGLVVGANLNAALAKARQSRLKTAMTVQQ